MKSITQMKEAYLLPERCPFSEIKDVHLDGTIRIVPNFRELGAVELEDATILVFQDTDGRIMQIEYDIKGAYKTPLVIL